MENNLKAAKALSNFMGNILISNFFKSEIKKVFLNSFMFFAYISVLVSTTLFAAIESKSKVSCKISADQNISKDKQLALLQEAFVKLDKKSVSWHALEYRLFLKALRQFQEENKSEYPDLSSLWPKIESLKVKQQVKPVDQDVAISPPKKLKQILTPKLYKSPATESVHWESPSKAWQIKSSFERKESNFKTLYLHYQGQKVPIEDGFLKYGTENIEFPNAIYFFKTENRPAKLFLLKDGEIYLDDMKDVVMSSTSAIHRLVGTADGMHIAKYHFSSTELQIESERFYPFNLGFPINSMQMGKSTLLSFRDPSFDRPILSTEDIYKKLRIIDFKNDTHTYRNLEEFTTDFSAEFTDSNLFLFRDKETAEVYVVHESESKANISKLDLNTFHNDALWFNKFKLHKLNNNYLLVEVLWGTEGLYLYQFDGANSFNFIKKFDDLSVAKGDGRELLLNDLTTGLWFKTASNKNFRLLKQNITGDWLAMDNGLLARSLSNKLELARRDEKNKISKFFEMELPSEFNTIKEKAFFIEERYLIFEFAQGGIVFLDTLTSKPELKKLEMDRLSNYAFTKDSVYSYLVLYNRSQKETPLVVILENETFDYAVKLDLSSTALSIGNRMSTGGIYTSGEKLHLGDSYNMKVYYLENW
ncbi:MAG: hypothetical protein VX642_11025 [Bdellovibrionota bacterium]|nr:hypothetical protein [Bdellovibrionota bacterium]